MRTRSPTTARSASTQSTAGTSAASTQRTAECSNARGSGAPGAGRARWTRSTPDVDRQIGSDAAVRDDLRPQLLAALPHDGSGLVLPRLHSTARQFPPAGQRRWPRALRDEQAPVADQGSGDDGGRGRELFRASG